MDIKRRGFLRGLFGGGLVLPFVSKDVPKPIEPAPQQITLIEVQNQLASTCLNTYSCTGGSFMMDGRGPIWTPDETFGYRALKK